MLTLPTPTKGDDKEQMMDDLKTSEGAENFICFLIDKCEGDEISEVHLQFRYADFLRDKKYNTEKKDYQSLQSQCDRYKKALEEIKQKAFIEGKDCDVWYRIYKLASEALTNNTKEDSTNG